MEPSRLSSSFIVRVKTSGTRQRILVHNLRDQEVLEFSSWMEFLRYVQSLPDKTTLR